MVKLIDQSQDKLWFDRISTFVSKEHIRAQGFAKPRAVRKIRGSDIEVIKSNCLMWKVQ